LNNQTACLARTLGIKTRETAKYLCDASNRLQGESFIRWIGNLTHVDIQNFALTDYEKK